MTSTPWSFSARSRTSAPDCGVEFRVMAWGACWSVMAGTHKPAGRGASTRLANKRFNKSAQFSFRKLRQTGDSRMDRMQCAAGAASSWWRNQVACRLVYCPVTSSARRRRLRQRDLAAQIGRQFRHAVRAHRRQRRVEPQRQQRPHLLQRALRPAWPRTGAAMAARSASRGGSSSTRGEAPRRRRGRLRPARRPGPGRCARHTSHARASRWLSVGRSRAAVSGSTSASAACSAGRAGSASSRRASARAGAGHRGISREPVHQRREIQPGAAAQDRQPPRRARRRHGRQRRAAPPGHVARLGRRPHAVQTVRHPRLLRRRRPRGEDAQFAIAPAWRRR